MDKREFLKGIASIGAGTAMSGSLAEWIRKFSSLSAEDLANDESFWAGVRKKYRIKPDYINLENGYYCFMPEEVLEKYIQHVRDVNYEASYYMRTVQFDNKKLMATKLASIAGCSPDELIITRNTTESLDMI